MARPRTPIGHYGTIKAKKIGPSTWEAKARFRMRNGRMRPIRRRGPSKNKAINNLKTAIDTLRNATNSGKITGDTPMGRVMDLWLSDFGDKVDRGVRAPKSLQEYRSVINGYLKPELGELACREAENAGLVDETLKAIRVKAGKVKGRGKNGDAAAKRARTVLSGVCGYAVRHGAMDTNPVKSAEAMDHEQEEIRALEPVERRDFLDKLGVWIVEKVEGKNRLGVRARAWTDLPDLVIGMLSTGLRIGEALALVGDSIDMTAGKVLADHHLVRIPGRGMVRMPKRKGNRGAVEPGITSWSTSMWRRRKLESGGAALFPAWNGGWEDPGNVARRIREACDGIGYGWVSSRMFRHTTATHLGDSALTAEAIADQLGNTAAVVEKHYRRKRTANPAVTAALEDLMGG